jgi:short-subunit dehydrogenase
MDEIWILGASSQAGRVIAAELAARQMPMVLLGRDASGLDSLAKTIGGKARVVVASSVDAIVTGHK